MKPVENLLPMRNEKMDINAVDVRIKSMFILTPENVQSKDFNEVVSAVFDQRRSSI